MSEYPFNLQGRQESFKGTGRKDDEVEVSQEFILEQGVVIAEIEHHGYGDFQLLFISEEFVGDTAGAAGGAILGATVGSVIPIFGTILGGAVGGVVGKALGEEYGNSTTKWKPVDCEGKFKTWVLGQIKDDDDNCLDPGKYCIEVKSNDRWTCRFIQPDLGQSDGPLVDEDDNINGDSIDDGVYILGPLKSGSRPVRAHIRHNGRGKFYAASYSVDGTHQCIVFEEEGQFQIEDHPTEIKPGKEYLLHISADGTWNLNFIEGY